MKHNIFFSLIIGLSAFLLFSIQPLFTKLLLPVFGGVSQVWVVSMVFYQGILLLGYTYSYLITRFLSLKSQFFVHLLCVLLSCVQLFIASDFIHFKECLGGSLYQELFTLLITTIGSSFFVLSTTAPLLQSWFSFTDHKSATNPYSLYVASNVGGLLGVLGYPIVIEPFCLLSQQSIFWERAYVAFVVAIIVLVILLFKKIPREYLLSKNKSMNIKGLNFKLVLLWLLLSFLPAALLLSFTNYLNQTLPSVPLLWVLPLSLYMLSFIWVFRKKSQLQIRTLVGGGAMIFLCYILGNLFLDLSFEIHAAFHLVIFFLMTSICLQKLYQLRPQVEKLTLFYLCVSLGGVLGAVFNGFIVATYFVVPLEYDFVFMLILLFILIDRQVQWFFPKIFNLVLFPFLLGGMLYLFYWKTTDLKLIGILVFLVMITSLSFLKYSSLIVLSGLSVVFVKNINSDILLRGRNFFGSYDVVRNNQSHFFSNGNVFHGSQICLPNYKNIPTSYYHHEGPVGDVFNFLEDTCINETHNQDIAAVGLGCGVVAAYGRDYHQMDFYEINPAVIKVAQNPKCFTYLQDTDAEIQIYQGDARKLLEFSNLEQKYDLLFADSFVSDNIPVHLISTEAVQLYLSRLKEHGILLFHISSRTLNLESMLSQMAREIGGLYVLSKVDNSEYWNADALLQKTNKQAHCLLFLKHEEQLNFFIKQGWSIVNQETYVQPWTDDYSNILKSLRCLDLL